MYPEFSASAIEIDPDAVSASHENGGGNAAAGFDVKPAAVNARAAEYAAAGDADRSAVRTGTDAGARAGDGAAVHDRELPVRVHIDGIHRRPGIDEHLSRSASVSVKRRGCHASAGGRGRVEDAAFDICHSAFHTLQVGGPGRHIDDRVGDDRAAELAAADVHRAAAADRAVVDDAGSAAAAKDIEFPGGKCLVQGISAIIDDDFAAFVDALGAVSIEPDIPAVHHGARCRSAGRNIHDAGAHRDIGGGAAAVDIRGPAEDIPAEGFPAAVDHHGPARADLGRGSYAAVRDIHVPACADIGRECASAAGNPHHAARTDVA